MAPAREDGSAGEEVGPEPEGREDADPEPEGREDADPEPPARHGGDDSSRKEGAAGELRRRQEVEDELDEALAGTFPASDPVSITAPRSSRGRSK